MIDCKAIAAKIKEELKPLVTKDKGLAIIQVGDNPASSIYVKNKIKDCEELGIPSYLYKFSDDVTEYELVSLIDELNHTDKIKGIICQLPLPKHLNEERITNAIADEKDVDGFKATSKYIPATPKGVMTILDSLGIDLAGKRVCLVGKGKTTNAPLIPLLLDKGTTLTICHSRTPKDDLEHIVLISDIIITAVGKPNTIKAKMFADYIEKPYKDAITIFDEDGNDMYIEFPETYTIIDVGISRDENGKQIGDCEKILHDIIPNINGWTNGTGLMTRMGLLQNLLEE